VIGAISIYKISLNTIMNLFENEYKDEYLKHHTNPINPNELDPTVFYSEQVGGDPKMVPGVRSQILMDIDAINAAENESVKTRVFDYVVVGPILQKDSSKFCPITVYVKLNTYNLDDILSERILNCIKVINDRRAPNTTHPLHYIPTTRESNKPFEQDENFLDKWGNVYHPFYEKWLRKPRKLGESRHSLEKLGDPAKYKKSTYKRMSLKKGIKKLSTI